MLYYTSGNQNQDIPKEAFSNLLEFMMCLETDCCFETQLRDAQDWTRLDRSQSHTKMITDEFIA